MPLRDQLEVLVKIFFGIIRYNKFAQMFFMRFALYFAICVFLVADILMAQELWGLMKSKGYIRDEIFTAPTVLKKR